MGCQPVKIALFLSGLFAALAYNFDLAPGGCILLGFAVLAFWRDKRPRDLLAYALGAAGPLALHIVLDYLVTGGLKPPYLYPEYYAYKGSVLKSYDALKVLYGDSVPAQLFHMYFGYRGLFLYFPILLFGLYESLRRVFRGGPLRPLALLALGSLIAVAVAYAIQTPGMAGGSYGMRWLLPLIPLLALFMGTCYERLARRGRLLFAAAAVWSVAIAALGVPRPWSSNIRSPFTFLDNLAYFAQALFPPAPAPVYWIVEATSLEKPYAYLEIGRWHMNEGYAKAAIRDLEHARAIESRRDNQILINYYLGMLYDQSGRPDLAVDAYERLLALDPENTGALNNYALALWNLGVPERALQVYRRSLALDPVRPAALIGLTALCGALGKPADAVPHWERAVALQPENADLRFGLARLYDVIGEKRKALEQLRRINALRPEASIRQAIDKLESELTPPPIPP